MNEIEIASKIREVTERLIIEDEEFKEYPINLSGLCAICSVALFRLLNNMDINVKLIKGLFRGKHTHCWVDTEKETIDITATQFWGIKKPVMILNRSGRIHSELYQYGFEVQSFDVFDPWWEEQKPTEQRVNKIISLIDGRN